jgi:cytochrome c-type biogenesis protein CcmE
MKLKFRQRLGVILFAVFVICAVVGLSFLVGYIVGKIFL